MVQVPCDPEATRPGTLNLKIIILKGVHIGDDEMTNKPPYTITEKSADYLAKIVETVTTWIPGHS